MPKTLDEAIAEKQTEFDALDMQSARIQSLPRIAELQERKALVLRALEALQAKKKASKE